MADKKISQLTGATTPLAGTEVLPIVQGGSTVKVSIANVTAGRSVATGPITASVADNGGISIVQSLAGETGFLNFVDSDAGLAGRVKYDHSNNSLQFISNAVEHVRIDSSGNVKNNLGNFIVGTAAKGVSFSENTPAAGMTSQLLNWYEQGNWNPTLSCGTSGTITLTSGDGTYTRVGNQVTVTCYIDVASVASPVGVLFVDGLPFASGSSAKNRSAAAVYANGLETTATTSIVGRIVPSESRIRLEKFAAGVTSALAGDVKAGSAFQISLTYLV